MLPAFAGVQAYCQSDHDCGEGFAVIIAGWIVYALVYFAFAMSTSAPVFIAWFLFYGVYFALAEGGTSDTLQFYLVATSLNGTFRG